VPEQSTLTNPADQREGTEVSSQLVAFSEEKVRTTVAPLKDIELELILRVAVGKFTPDGIVDMVVVVDGGRFSEASISHADRASEFHCTHVIWIVLP
jgi:hypothetical protein